MARNPRNPKNPGVHETPGPEGFSDVWPRDWGQQEFGSNQARAHYARPGGPAQGRLLGRVIPESNNVPGPTMPALTGGDTPPSEKHGPEGPARNPRR